MKKLAAFLICFLLLTTVTVPAFANSAEPPGFIILCNDLPEDAEITLVIPNDQEDDGWEGSHRRVDKLWETQYRLWVGPFSNDLEGAYIRVSSSEKTFTCPLPGGPDYTYNTVLTLDYAAQTLTLGQNPWRQVLLTVIRVVLTLLIEALIFFAYGFRQKRSWILFLVINLLTQAWLNSIINTHAFGSGYWMLILYGMEAVIFLAEAASFALLGREKEGKERIDCAVVANLLSLILGLLLINQLPI